jgi:hypothetical protein
LTTDKRHAVKHALRLAVLADEIKEEVIYTGTRMRLVTGLLHALAPIARRLGYRTEYKDSRGRIVALPSRIGPGSAAGRTAAGIALVAGGLLSLWWLRNH